MVILLTNRQRRLFHGLAYNFSPTLGPLAGIQTGARQKRPGNANLFMSLIHTCELNGANPFDYLTELQRYAEELKQTPSDWMPWNYRNTLARLATPAVA